VTSSSENIVVTVFAPTRIERYEHFAKQIKGIYEISILRKFFRFFILQNDKILIINIFVILTVSEKSVNDQHFVKTYRTIKI
jgi:hypothetical protein